MRNYGRVREEFRNVDLEYLLDSAPAARDFLKANREGAAELQEMRALTERPSLLEKALEASAELAASREGMRRRRRS